jgi:hypothetical protein
LVAAILRIGGRYRDRTGSPPPESGDTQELELTWSFFKSKSQSSRWREWIALGSQKLSATELFQKGLPSGVAGEGICRMLGYQGFLYAGDPGSYTSSSGGNRLRGSGRSGISVRVLLVLVQALSQRRREEKQYEGSVSCEVQSRWERL